MKGKGKDRLGLPGTELNRTPAPTTQEPPRGGLISLCKNFAFSNLF